jgi:hypothetical protein
VGRLVVLLAVACGACGSEPSQTQLPTGIWGGDHLAITVTAAGANIEFDCAHGSVDEPPVLDSTGQFALDGFYVREHGGPVHEGEAEDRHAAVYSGRLQRSNLTLSIRLPDEGTVVGPFSATHGQRGTLLKCL